MSVNGIEIKVGQTWKTREGQEVRIVKTNYRTHLYPVVVDNGHLYTVRGQYDCSQGEHAYDLVELVKDAPAAYIPTIGMVEPPAAESAPDILDKAAGHMRDRAATYDKPEGERSMLQTVEIFNRYHGTSLTEAQGWHFMQVLKDVRMFSRGGYHADSGEDGVAYAALKCEAKAREVV